MTQQDHFQRGDVVRHPRRPEWGQGVVKDIRVITHEGRTAQRLTVAFANRGRVVINTAVAPLERHRSEEAMNRSYTATATAGRASGGTGGSGGTSGGGGSGGSGGGWLAQLEQANGQRKHELWGLPDPMVDPFAPLSKRLEATVDSYRFSTEPRSLIEWASAQTGLDDPLSKYTRSELEQAFPRFARDRDQHLFDLVRQLKRKGEMHVVQQLAAKVRHPAAKQALQKVGRY